MDRTIEYSKVVWPDEWVILGRRLQPFSIGHALLLHRLGLPFMEQGAGSGKHGAKSGDLIIAVEICARPYDLAVRWIGSAWLKRRLWWRNIVFAWRYRNTAIVQQGKYSLYLQEAWRCPPVISLRDREYEAGAPFLLNLQCLLMKELRCSEAESLRIPLAKALWWACAIGEANGGFRIQNKREDGLVEASLKMANEMADQKAISPLITTKKEGSNV